MNIMTQLTRDRGQTEHMANEKHNKTSVGVTVHLPAGWRISRRNSSREGGAGAPDQGLQGPWLVCSDPIRLGHVHMVPPKCPGDIYIIAKGSMGKKLNAWIYLFLPVKMATLVIHYKKLHESKWNICLWAKTVLTGESLCSRHCNRVTDTTRKQKCFYI